MIDKNKRLQGCTSIYNVIKRHNLGKMGGSGGNEKAGF
jgi:hypothetical protein